MKNWFKKFQKQEVLPEPEVPLVSGGSIALTPETPTQEDYESLLQKVEQQHQMILRYEEGEIDNDVMIQTMDQEIKNHKLQIETLTLTNQKYRKFYEYMYEHRSRTNGLFDEAHVIMDRED